MKVLSFDTETTGLPMPCGMPVQAQPRIIEIAAVCVDTDTGKIEEVIDTLVNPGMEIPPEITKITGIRDVHVRKQPKWADLDESRDKFINLLGSADVITAHNLRFDITMVDFEMRRLGGSLDVSDGDLVCTVEQTEFLQGFRLKLEALYEFLVGKRADQAHRALDDVKIQLECFRLLVAGGYLPHLGIAEWGNPDA